MISPKRRFEFRRKFKINYVNLIPICDHWCVICKTNNNLDGHHIRERKDGGTDDIDNLMAVCKFHHNQIHNKKSQMVTKKYQLLVKIRRLQMESRRLKDKSNEMKKLAEEILI